MLADWPNTGQDEKPQKVQLQSPLTLIGRCRGYEVCCACLDSSKCKQF